jgi:hypothetical protein
MPGNIEYYRIVSIAAVIAREASGPGELSPGPLAITRAA